jgi:branched-chain amino acid transport system permease protein
MEFLSSIGITEIVIQFMLVNAILGLSIYLTLYTGMFSLANAGFMAIGAYVSVYMTQSLELPLWLALIGGALVAGLIAVPIGLPVLRLRDIYLAIATIGFGEVVRIVILNFDNVILTLTGERVRITRGPLGITGIPRITETWHLLLMIALISYFLIRLHRSRFGRAMAAIRQDEQAAANMGINVVYVKNVVFIMSAVIAALGGVTSAHLTRAINPNLFGFDRAVDILTFAVLGGTTTWIGPIVGAGVLTGMPEILRFTSQYRGVINGAILLLMIVYVPGGLVNPAGWLWLWRRLRGADDEPIELKAETG